MERTAHPGKANPPQRYLPVIQECRDMALVHFNGWMTELFEKVEPALLDFIDKADTNQSQFQFIDAISVVRSHRDAVEHRFHEEIARGFSEFMRGEPISYPFPLLESQMQASDGLELVDDNELNQRLSLQSMIDKTEGRCFQQIYALKQRLAMVRGGHKLDDTDIPAGPSHCASAFQAATAEFAFETNVLLIIHAMFEKFVMRNMAILYEEFNEKLIEAGVFPNLKLETPKQPHSEGADSGQGAAEEGYAEGNEPAPGQADEEAGPGGESRPLGEELFNSIRELMASARFCEPTHHRYRFTPWRNRNRQSALLHRGAHFVVIQTRHILRCFIRLRDWFWMKPPILAI